MTTFSWGSRPEDARCSVLGLGVGDVTAFPHLQVVATGHRRHLSCQEQRPFRLGRLWNGQSQDKDQYMYQQYRVQQYKTTFFFCVCVCVSRSCSSHVMRTGFTSKKRAIPVSEAIRKGSRGGTHKASAFPAQPVPLLSLLDPMSQVVSAGWENHVVAKLARQTTKGPEEGRGGGGGGEKRKAGTSFFSFPVSQSAPCIAAQVGIA